MLYNRAFPVKTAFQAKIQGLISKKPNKKLKLYPTTNNLP